MSLNRSTTNRPYPSSKKKDKQKNSYVVETRQELCIKPEPNIRKKFSTHDIKYVKPLTENQRLAFQEWGQGQNIVMGGYAGTGKTFIALYLALQTVLDPSSKQDKIVIIRSAVSSRDIGHLPGTEEEKLSAYESPYIQICDKLFKWDNTYKNMKDIGIIEFESTSFLRGITFDNAVILVDECQNLDNQSEADTVITRVGEDSRVIFCGDILQNDLGKKSACEEIFKTFRKMESISFIDFKLADIVRSGWVKEYLMAKYS